jgi:CspA family cold shock protein
MSTYHNTGSLKFFNAAKGFGFVTRDDNAEDCFFHISALRAAGIDPADLIDGKTKLSFDVQKDVKGWKATDIAIAS